MWFWLKLRMGLRSAANTSRIAQTKETALIKINKWTIQKSHYRLIEQVIHMIRHSRAYLTSMYGFLLGFLVSHKQKRGMKNSRLPFHVFWSKFLSGSVLPFCLHRRLYHKRLGLSYRVCPPTWAGIRFWLSYLRISSPNGLAQDSPRLQHARAKYEFLGAIFYFLFYRSSQATDIKLRMSGSIAMLFDFRSTTHKCTHSLHARLVDSINQLACVRMRRCMDVYAN